MSKIDIAVIIAYLIGTTLFGCSFFFRRKEGGDDADRAFMTGGGTLPTWAIALSVFATYVSSISFLTLPEGAYGPDCWRGWVNSITVPIATLVAAVWFIATFLVEALAIAVVALEGGMLHDLLDGFAQLLAELDAYYALNGAAFALELLVLLLLHLPTLRLMPMVRMLLLPPQRRLAMMQRTLLLPLS